jgi:dTDP-4-dehydrorhamnose reductase
MDGHTQIPAAHATAGESALRATSTTQRQSSLEVWGGLECTVARVGDSYVDQTVLNGHQHRVVDLDAFAALGIHAMRYPVLWERVAPDGLESADWRWTDERLARMRNLGIRPIAGLLHHGSGPRCTDLSQPDFPAKLADYAAAVAKRYPWLDHYTPVNEPLTTARFSGLYGHWYPHGRDYGLFLRLLVNQLNGVRLAMRAIRQVNPAARLVQTDDLGRTLSTPRLAYQAAYENERRWLSFDLLTGRFDRQHALWRDVTDAVPARALDALLADPCPPDIVGINHYLSGERFLDEQLERYPGVMPGGNGRDRYVDVLAPRVVQHGVAGLENLLEEAWERYGLPMAVTEVHNGSSRDEQLRWLKEAWDSARRLRGRGVDMRAITAWSLLGTYDWDSLLTRRDGHYEPGVFDVSGRVPRPTALAGLIRDLARTGEADHPALDTPGWWHRDCRLAWEPAQCCPSTLPQRPMAAFSGTIEPRTLLITGGGGALAQALAHVCIVRGLPHRVLSRADLDVADAVSIGAAVDRWRPWAIVNAAGSSRVDRAEDAPDLCWRENVLAAETLSRACTAAGIPLVAFSSHLVFGGEKVEPYLEHDPVAPLGVYAKAKVEAERILLSACPDALVIRAGSFFGPWDPRNMLTRAIRAIGAGKPFAAASDITVSPTYLPDLADTTLDLLMDGECGIWHLASAGMVTWAELARAAVAGAALDGSSVRAVLSAELGWRAKRPAQSALRSRRSALMPPLDKALGCYLGALRSGSSDIVTGTWLTRHRPPG